MARTLIYERSVQSVVIDANLYQQLSCPGNKVRIKEEPPDWDSDAGTENARERLDSQPSSSVSNKENLCTSETRKKRKRKRNDYVRRRRSRVKKVKGKGKDGTLEKKSRDASRERERERERERKQFNEIPGNLEDNRTSRKSGVSAKEADQKKEKYTVGEAGVASGGKSARGKKTRRKLECKECFLSFPNASTLERHERCYRNQLIVCTACNTGFYLKSSFLRHDAYCRRTKKGGKFQCHFCVTKFLGKTFLQSHLFHSHRNSIFPAAEPACVSNGKDPAVPSVPDEPGGKLLRSGRTSVSKVESAVSKKAEGKELESGEPSAQPKVVAQLASGKSAVNVEKIGSSFIEKTGITDTRQQTSTPGKKMRQTILTEFLRVSSKCCKDEPRSPAKDEELQPVGRLQEHAVPGAGDPRDRHQADRKRIVRPFVHLHASPDAMQEFLDRLTNMKDEPSDESPFQRENSSSSLRATRQSDHRAERVNEVSAKRRLSETAEASHDSSPRPSVKRVRTTFPVEQDKARPRPEPQLKDCFVPLLRCDAVAEISKHPASNSPLRSQSPGPEEEKEGSGPAELEKRRYQCKICKKRFFTKRNLIEHEEFFHVAYMSSICNARYTSKYKLLHHYLRQHTKFKRSVLCCVCEENFPSRSTLQRHLLLHCIRVLLSKHDRFPIDSVVKCNAFRKNHRCEKCGKRFWLSSCLKQHDNFCSLRKQERSEIKADDPPSLEGNTDSAGKESPKGSPKGSPKESEKWTVDSSGVKNGAKDSATFQAEMPDKLSGGKKNKKKKKKKQRTMVQEKSVEEEGKTAAKGRMKNGEESREESQMERANEGKEVGSYSCRVCKISFESMEKLSSHERRFFGDAKERCSDCGTAFPNRGLLQTHKKTSHSETTGPLYKFQCKFCKQAFNKERSKQMHEEHFHLSKIAVAPEQTWLNEEQVWNINTVCSICNLMFETYDKFLEHNIYYYKGHTFTCSFCGTTFHGMYMLHHHNKLVHYPSIRTKSYSYLCDICNEGFNQLSHFHAHKLHVHLPDAASKSGPADGQSGCGPEEAAAAAAAAQFVEAEAGKLSLSEAKQPAYAVYPCNICQLIFSNKTDFLTHQMEYSRNGNYLCNACDRRCRTFDILTQHYSLNHQDDNVPDALKCPDCREVLTTSVSMLSHRKHFHPREADGRYELLAALERNVDRFMDSANHGKSHDGPPATASLKCITCAMLFENMADLKNHLLDYSNIGDHSCAVCHRRFPQSKSLEEHKVKHSRLHTILAEHRCSVCQEGFGTPQLATAHVLHFHGQETFQNIFSKRITVVTGESSASADNASVLAKAKDQRSSRRDENHGEFYICDICQGSYSSEVILANHRQQHRLSANTTTKESNPASSPISAAGHSTAEAVGGEERSASASVTPSTAARRPEKHSPARASSSSSQGRSSKSERPPPTTNLPIAGATDQPRIIQVPPSSSPGRSTPHSTLLRNSNQALIRTNNAETVLQCSLCCLRFASESSFREHVEDRMCKEETTRLLPAFVPAASGEPSRQQFTKPLRSLSADSTEDLKIIWDKNSLATDPAASLVQAVVNQETCPPSSGISSGISSNGIAIGSENRNLPRLKVKPLAKIIESLTVKNLPKSLLVNQSQPGPSTRSITSDS